MKNFTKENYEAVVNYAMVVYETVTPGLKDAAEKVATYFGESQELFIGKPIIDSTDENQKALEYVLRYAALDDTEAFEKLCNLKEVKKNAAFAKKDYSSDGLFETEDYLSYLFECVSSLSWVAPLQKKTPILTILKVQVSGRILRAKQINEAGGESYINAQDLGGLLKHFNGDLFRILEMSFEEYKAIFPRRGRKAYQNVLALADKRRETSYDGLLSTYNIDESKGHVFADACAEEDSLQEGFRDTFQNAIQYTQTIIKKAEDLEDSVTADKFRSVNLGYQMLLDIYTDEKATSAKKKEVFAYYSRCKEYSKLCAAHTFSYFTKKAIEDFTTNWKFYADGDEKVITYLQRGFQKLETA